MKTRQGFVSNSSSSSFVIAYKKDYANADLSIFKLLEESKKYDYDKSSYTKVKFIGNKEDFYKYYKDEICNGYSDEMNSDYIEKINDFFKDKNELEWGIAEVSIDNCDNTANAYVKMDKNIVVLNCWT